MGFTKNTIEQFVIIENYICNFLNENNQLIIDSFLPFIGKKIFTAKQDYINKYTSPKLNNINTKDINIIGVNMLNQPTIHSTHWRESSNVNIRFSFHGGLFEKNYSNPYTSIYVERLAVNLEHSEGVLTNVKCSNHTTLLDPVKVLKDYQTALDKKAEYESALKNVESLLKIGITKY